MKMFIFLTIIVLISVPVFAEEIIINHSTATLGSIPASAINQAKSNLHIAYGHTSHGSQLIIGMTGLEGQSSLTGYQGDIYDWNEGGTGGALDIDDYFASGDLGNPDWTTWATRTRTYLDNAANSDVNVVIWSWCGQVSGASETNINTYLSSMEGLITDYPDVTFVFMTGHLDGTGTSGNLHLRNEQIRQYCQTNDKVLYDFADIESYDPDDTYYLDKDANDNCDYDSNDDGSRDANWATAWENSHTEGVDWYDCSAAHSQALNGNRKAYAAWWLWARLGGWSGPDGEGETAPVADFTGTPTTVNINQPVQFVSSCTETVTGFSWDFGDSTTSTRANPKHAYTAAGTYTVAVTATNSGGSDTKTRTGYITVTSTVDPPDTSNTVWYFAEGSTRNSPRQFYEWITIQNPGNSTADVTLSCMDTDGNIETSDTSIESQRRYTADISTLMDNRDVSVTVQSTNLQPIIAERVMYWDSSGITYAGGHATHGVTAAAETWYFAEGSTRIEPRQYYQYITIQNPGVTTAEVKVTFMDTAGNTAIVEPSIAGQRRYTVTVSDHMSNSDLSTTVESTNSVPIIAERPMYWDSEAQTSASSKAVPVGCSEAQTSASPKAVPVGASTEYTFIGGHVAPGVTAAADTWYFAEGSTRTGTPQYYEWITIQNPGLTSADVKATFMDSSGNTAIVERSIAGLRRDTINVNSSMENKDVSATVETTNGALVIAERPMYWTAGGIPYVGGHVAPGITATGYTWCFAEGSTRNSPYNFDEWITMQNPGVATANVKLTFMDSSGNTVITNTTIAGQRRGTVSVNAHMDNLDVSTTVEATNGVPMIAERPMYWDSGSITDVGGHNSPGVEY